MKKIIRNMSDDASKAFWASMKESAAPVKDWPAWKKAGINLNEQHFETFGPAIDVSLPLLREEDHEKAACGEDMRPQGEPRDTHPETDQDIPGSSGGVRDAELGGGDAEWETLREVWPGDRECGLDLRSATDGNVPGTGGQDSGGGSNGGTARVARKGSEFWSSRRSRAECQGGFGGTEEGCSTLSGTDEDLEQQRR